MLATRGERLKLGFSLLILGFVFWALFVSPRTNLGQYFLGKTPQILGVAAERSPLQAAILSSEDFLGLMQGGQKFLAEGKYELAMFAFQRASELRPNYRDSHYLLGYTYLKLYEQTGDYLTDPSPADPYAQPTTRELAKLALLRAQKLDPLSKKIAGLLEKITETGFDFE